MTPLSAKIWLLSLACLCQACATTTAQVQWTRELRTRIEPHAGVAVVSARNEGKEEPLPTAAAECIRSTMRSAHPGLDIVSPETLYTLIFPENQQAAITKEQLSQAIDNRVLRDKIASLGLRYLILTHGSTVRLNTQPILWAVGGPGGCCFTGMGARWNRRSEVTATVFDLKRFDVAGEIAVSASGEPWVVCVGAFVFCAPFGVPAFTESKACKELSAVVARFLAGENLDNRTVVYGEDDRVRYSYDPDAAPTERYSQALERLTHPFTTAEGPGCSPVRACVERYVEEARRRAFEVGYPHHDADEESFRKDLDLAAQVDAGDMTREGALREKRSPNDNELQPGVFGQGATARCTDRRKTAVTPDLYDRIHELTEGLLTRIADERGPTYTVTVSRYVADFRRLAGSSHYPLICADNEIFMQELEIAGAVDAGTIARAAGIRDLQVVTMRHLINLYFGRP